MFYKVCVTVYISHLEKCGLRLCTNMQIYTHLYVALMMGMQGMYPMQPYRACLHMYLAHMHIYPICLPRCKSRHEPIGVRGFLRYFFCFVLDVGRRERTKEE